MWCYGQGKFMVSVMVGFVNMFGVMVIVNTTQNLNPDPQNEIAEGVGIGRGLQLGLVKSYGQG